MRQAAFILIILCEGLIALTRNMEVNGSGLSFMSTLIVVVIIAFASSALFHRFLENMAMSRNYGISGIIGVAAGALFYAWVKDNIELLINWLADYGLWILLIVILISAFALFMMPKTKEVEA